MASVLIALGSNLGERLSRLQEAVAALGPNVRVMRVSGVYETAPMYVADQPAFLNAALMAETSLSPMALLARLKSVELSVGRLPRDRYGPREIDLDLIAYGVVEYRFMRDGQPVLELPHPRAGERRFVLQPLADVAPDFPLPPYGLVRDLLEATLDQSAGIRRVEGAGIG